MVGAPVTLAGGLVAGVAAPVGSSVGPMVGTPVTLAGRRVVGASVQILTQLEGYVGVGVDPVVGVDLGPAVGVVVGVAVGVPVAVEGLDVGVVSLTLTPGVPYQENVGSVDSSEKNNT